MLGLFNRQDTKTQNTKTNDTKTNDTKTTSPETKPQDKRPAVMQPFRSLSTLLVGGGIALAAVALSGVGNWTRDIGDWFQENAAITQSAPKVDLRSLTINKIQGASELTTMVFSTEAIIPTSRDLQLGQMVLGSTRLLYIAYGEVRAGIDLGAVQPEDVVWDGNTLTVTLPAPKILDSKIDVSRSRVYDYNRGFLGLGPDVAPQLMAMAQQKALDAVTQSACDRGLMTQAGERAKTVVAQLLGSSITDATASAATAEGAAATPQPTINIVVSEGSATGCGIAQSGSTSSSQSTVPDGAIAPAQQPSSGSSAAPNSAPNSAPADNTNASADPLPVPAVP